MKQIIAFLAVLLVVFAHSKEKSERAKCSYTSINGGRYDLSALRLTAGTPYTFSLDGEEWMFNVCGDLENLAAFNCPKDAAVCVRNNSVAVNAGKRTVWTSLDNVDEKGVSISYLDGESCVNQTERLTKINFRCPFPAKNSQPHAARKPSHSRPESDASGRLVVTDAHHEDACHTVVNVETFFACQFEKETVVLVNPLLPFMVLLTILASCLCCCVCCIRRRNHKLRRARNQEAEMIQFSNIAFEQIPQEPPMISLQRVEPQAPQWSPSVSRNHLPAQYIQAPQYFLYPSVQSPGVLEKELLISADEKYARDLQAQLDREYV